MMSNFADKVIVRMDLSLRVILLNEVVNKIGCVHDLLLRSTTARCRQIIEAVIFLFRATLCVLVLKPGTSCIRVHLSSTFLNNLFEADLEETRWNYIHFAHV